MGTARLNSKNQIVLPKEAREAMGVKSCDELLLVVKGDVTVIMAKPKRSYAALAGAGKGAYRKAHLKTERSSWYAVRQWMPFPNVIPTASVRVKKYSAPLNPSTLQHRLSRPALLRTLAGLGDPAHRPPGRGT